VIPLSESGSKTNPTALESMSGARVINTKENGKCASDMVKDVTSLPLATTMSGSTILAELRATVNIPGAMGTPTLASFSTARRMVKDIGAKVRPKTATNTQVNTRPIKSKVMENLAGPQAQSIRATTLKTPSRVMAKCIGLMEVYLEASGRMATKVDLV